MQQSRQLGSPHPAASTAAVGALVELFAVLSAPMSEARETVVDL
jgi:hypothetical protein